MMKEISEGAIKRLFKYRNTLENIISTDKKYLYSYELAEPLQLKSVQVRYDLMKIGYNAMVNKGYYIPNLIEKINLYTGKEKEIKVGLIGIGNLGKAIISHISCKKSHINIVAAFDNNPDKVNRLYAGVPCFHINELRKIISIHEIKIMVFTMENSAQEILEMIKDSGIKAVINYTSEPLQNTGEVYLEEHDLLTSLEKIAYYVKTKQNKDNK